METVDTRPYFFLGWTMVSGGIRLNAGFLAYFRAAALLGYTTRTTRLPSAGINVHAHADCPLGQQSRCAHSAALARATALAEGIAVERDVEDRQVVLRPRRIGQLSLADLRAGITSDNLPDESFDDRSVGREALQLAAPERGDLVRLSFAPHAGHEPAGGRPALVLSPRAYSPEDRLRPGLPDHHPHRGLPARGDPARRSPHPGRRPGRPARVGRPPRTTAKFRRGAGRPCLPAFIPINNAYDYACESDVMRHIPTRCRSGCAARCAITREMNR